MVEKSKKNEKKNLREDDNSGDEENFNPIKPGSIEHMLSKVEENARKIFQEMLKESRIQNERM